MTEQKFFRCEICGNLVGLINNSDVPMVCCGKPMKELVANSVDASKEKHMPVVEIKEHLVCVEVGSGATHPSDEAHHIDFIYLQTANGGMRKSVKVGSRPIAMFYMLNDTPISAFAYCNLHGLWKADVMCNCGCGKTVEQCEADYENDSDCGDDCGCGSDDAHSGGCDCGCGNGSECECDHK